MITSMTSPASERRARVRDLSNIDTTFFPDSKIDIKIDAADAYITLLFNGVPSEGGDLGSAKLEAAITASNLYASVLIRSGISGSKNAERIEELRMQISDLVQAANNLQGVQFKPIVRVTGGPSPGPNQGFGQ